MVLAVWGMLAIPGALPTPKRGKRRRSPTKSRYGLNGVGTVLIQVQRRLPCGLEDHLIEHAERHFLTRAVHPPLRDATAEGLRFLAACLLVFLHQRGLPGQQ